MQTKAIEWKVSHSKPKFSLSEARGRDRLIDSKTEDHLEGAYMEPIKHRRTRRLREQEWLVTVILQDSGMRPDEVFPIRVENIDWDRHRIWIPYGKTEQARRFVAMSQLSSGPTPHFDQSNCLEKPIGEPPSISMVELGFAPHKVEADLDA